MLEMSEEPLEEPTVLDEVLDVPARTEAPLPERLDLIQWVKSPYLSINNKIVITILLNVQEPGEHQFF